MIFTNKRNCNEKIKEILYTYIKKPKEKIQIPAYIKKKEKSWISPKEFYDRYVCFPFDDYACFLWEQMNKIALLKFL